nr:hypothetical protein [Tanacetum cinerariifolium]
MALLSMRADKFWKRTRKKISIQGSDVAEFDKSKVECFNCTRWVTSQENAEHPEVRKEEGKKAIDRGEDHALVVDAEASTEFALMANTESKWPSPTVASTSAEGQNKDSSTSEDVASPNTPKPFVKFVKPKDSQSKSGTNKHETPKKPQVKYAEQYRHSDKKPKVKGNQKNWNNLKSYQLGPEPHGFSMNPIRPNMNGARPNRSYETRPFYKSSAVKTQNRAPWVSTVNKNNPPVNRKFFTGRRNFPTVNKKIPTASRKFTTGSINFHTADMGRKGKVVKPSACWTWNPSQKLSNKGQFPDNIDDKGYWDRGCSRHMTGNRSYLSDFEPFDEGYVSFGQGGCKITGKGTIKTGKQHKVSYKSKLVNSVTKPLHTLQMDLFGLTSDESSTKVPKGSGNPNPTVSSSNPPADQMETRLISKRVANQEETPSLDNILSLTNRFEDIFGVTTSSDEAIGVEADISNMETTISASPTPTLKIHKDHPKSQIIGPVDTPIRTRHKSKENLRKSLMLFKTQAGWKLCKKSFFNSKSRKSGLWLIVLKGPDPLGQNGFSRIKRMKEELLIEAIRLFLAYASFMGFTMYQMDVKSAFLYGTINEKVYVMQPPGFQDPAFPAKVYKVEKAMYGLHQAPRAWYGTLSKYLLKNGFQRGTIDQALFIRRQREDFILVQVYVDDIIFGSSNPQLCREFEALMHEKFQMSAMDTTTTTTTSGETGMKLGRTVTLTAEDMQKKKNDVKARTTLLLSLPDEHQLRFSKYKTARELWAAILKTFGGNEATKKTKKNLFKQQYGNFRAKGSETLENTFSRLQAIVGQLQFIDVEVKQNNLNQKFLTSLAPEWLMHTIVWKNRSDLDTMSLDDLYNHLKVYESEVQKKTEPNS